MKSRMQYRTWIAVCGLCMALSGAGQAYAANYEDMGGPLSSEGYIAYVPADSADIYVSMDSWDILQTAPAGESFPITGTEGDGWMEIRVGDGVGYVSDQQVTIYSEEEWEAVQQDAAFQAQEQAAAADTLRQQVVNYALQFVGCRYVYGGTDPHSGVDCSGFARYVMQNAAGVWLDRTSASQACQGVTISADQIQPGDLVFYSSGGRVNHVAIYIGNGQIVHASTERTGVKVSNWTYRSPVRIARVLGV